MSKTTKGLTNAAGLKRRRVDAAAPTAKPKPRKMDLLRPRRKETNTGPANSALLVFPTDKMGITSDTKAAVIKAASRIGSDKAALKLFKDTMAVLMEHVDAKHKKMGSLPTLKRRVDHAAPVEDVEEAGTQLELPFDTGLTEPAKKKAAPKKRVAKKKTS